MYQYFEWENYIKNNPEITFPTTAIEDFILVDPTNKKVLLSRRFATWIFGNRANEVNPEMSFDDLQKYFTEDGYSRIKAEYYRLLDGKIPSVSIHVSLQLDDAALSSMVHLYRLENKTDLLSFISIDFEPIREFEEQLNSTINELQKAKAINELILEGSSDYIYQLDVVNNICTFSSKATDVLDLETPTFSNAMNRLLEFIVPEDRQIFLESYTPFLTGRSKYHTAEYRVITKTGDIMWISCRGKGMHDENGNPIIIAGSLMDITEQKRNEEKINKMLYYDDLTNLKNKLSFTKDMEKILQDKNNKGSLVYINIQKIKVLNELFGHHFGNRVIQEFARMLGLYFYDAKGIYHFNNGEFLIHLSNHIKNDITEKLAPILNILKREINVDGHWVHLSLNFAIVIYPNNGETTDELLNNANQCMYRLSRNEVEGLAFYDTQSSEDDDTMNFFLESELRKDIQNDFKHFRMVYQPIVNVQDGKEYWAGAEALLRYSSPNFANTNQMDVIMTLEFSGLIIDVGRWVIQQAVKECMKWRQYNPEAFVHVNLSAQQVSDASFIPFLVETCDRAGLPYHLLHLELTETSILKNFDMGKQFCKVLRNKGFGVALDDFGAGNSGFNYLRNLPITQIKVDIGFVRNIQDNPFNQIIVKFIHEIAEQMKLSVCAEGVETKEELDMLLGFKPDYIQGFYYEKPIEAEQFRAACPTKFLSI